MTEQENTIKSRVQLLQLLLYILPIAIIIDFFLRISLFEKDPAPSEARLIACIVFTLIYLFAAIMTSLGFFWARWIAFGLLAFWSALTVIIFVSTMDYLEGIGLIIGALEVIARIALLIVLIKSVPWIRAYKAIAAQG